MQIIRSQFNYRLNGFNSQKNVRALKLPTDSVKDLVAIDIKEEILLVIFK